MMANWQELASKITGELKWDDTTLMAYSTDASVYRFRPDAVLFPKSKADLLAAVSFARQYKLPIIPRGAGTSLAGQCVGSGLVVDTSRYLNQIIEINKEHAYVDVEPGVIRDKLNAELKSYGLWFSPNTSTASRCVIGGMVGNNSCGSTSIKYGDTRSKIISLDVILHDGTELTLCENNGIEINNAENNSRILSQFEKQIIDLLESPEVREEIKQKFPKPTVKRRNTGYAIDALIETKPFNVDAPELNLAKLFCGSEGTLGLTSRIRLKLDVLPPPTAAVVAIHFDHLIDAMHGAVLAMNFAPFACELIDRTILDLTKSNPEQAENRFFVQGDPAAILAVEIRSDDQESLNQLVDGFIQTLKESSTGTTYPVLLGDEIEKIWTLRAAGLGILSNMPGDAKPIAFVEDTAVALEDLPSYIAEFDALMQSFGQKAVYYAHAGAGELHLRPVLNLKLKSGRQAFRQIAEASADLVAKYQGSLSGEHGDGRVRGEFVPKLIGPKNYAIFREIKKIFDPHNMFNPGKVVDAFPMDADLRYSENQIPSPHVSFLNFGNENVLQSAERCNGSGDCRKESWTGAAMCPSYQATRNEMDSTRARANVLREVLTHPKNEAYPFDNDALPQVLDLCLSCKACARECPSNVDMTALKAEAMFHFQKRHGISLSTRFFGQFHQVAMIVQPFAHLTNFIQGIPFLEQRMKSVLGIANQRSIPKLSTKKASKSARKWAIKTGTPDCILYIDEFTEFQDPIPALHAAELLQKLSYKFKVIYAPSGRAGFSKSMLETAKKCALTCLGKLHPYANKSIPIVGVEPSAILGFRDEYLRLFSGERAEQAKILGKNSFTLEEFLYGEFEKGRIQKNQFTQESKEIHVHMHCHQRALSHVKFSKLGLGIPTNYTVRIIPSGCCGMAGSFGFESKKYDISQAIGNLNLFPHLNKFKDVTVVAAGTSCRHQIVDALGRKAIHPASLLLSALA